VAGEAPAYNNQFPAPFAALTATITARFTRAATETLNVSGNRLKAGDGFSKAEKERGERT